MRIHDHVFDFLILALEWLSGSHELCPSDGATAGPKTTNAGVVDGDERKWTRVGRLNTFVVHQGLVEDRLQCQLDDKLVFHNQEMGMFRAARLQDLVFDEVLEKQFDDKAA